MKKIKADLHNHLAGESLGEFVSKNFFNKVIDKAHEKLGSGGILGLGDCIEERYKEFIKHRDENSYDIEDLGNAIYVPEKDILVVRGQEVFAKEGDILVLGFDQKYFIGEIGDVRTRNLEECIKEAKDYGGIIGIDHGFFYQGSLPYLKKHPNLFEDIDFIEVHNGNAWIPLPGYFNSNKKAQEFYKEIEMEYPHLGAICSSDGHTVNEVGSSYSEIKDVIFSGPETLTEQLRKSVREHKGWSEDKRKNSYFGASVHTLGMIPLKILEKITGKYHSVSEK